MPFDCPVYVISRPCDTIRREKTEQRLKERGIIFEWFEASDGHNDVTQSEFRAESIEIRPDGPIEPGSNGVALSHKRLWRKIVAEDIPRCIIMEDDVIFHPEFDKLAPLYWKASPKEALIFLGHCGVKGQEGNRGLVETMPWCLHAYCITRDIAAWYLDHFGFCWDHLDVHMVNLKKNAPWRSFAWWDGTLKLPPTRLNVVFNGLIFQDHDPSTPNSIHPGL